MEFPYKHSTGETIGRFLAGLKEQKTIWGQRVAGHGVVVPPLGYSEVDGSDGGEWVAVKDTGVVTAVAVVHQPDRAAAPVRARRSPSSWSSSTAPTRRWRTSSRTISTALTVGARVAGGVGAGRRSAAAASATSPASASSAERGAHA